MIRPLWLPPWADLLLAGGFAVLVAAEGAATGTWVEVGGDPAHVDSPLLYLGLGIPAMVALGWRRRLPIAVAAAVIATNYVINVDGKTSTTLAVAFACYSVGAHSRRPGLGLAVAVVSFFLQWLAAGEQVVPSDLAAALVLVGVPWGAGRFVAARDLTADAAVERAEVLEREQVALAAAAAARERVRLARELHDVVSHSISVVAVQTQAIRRRLGPESQREADDLYAVEITAREAMAELRRLFGVLRTDEPGTTLTLSPQPGLDDLDRLVEHVRSTGIEVRLERQGEHTPLRAGVGLAAYRIVQEALTNVIKHAEARTVRVCVRQDALALDISVEDDGRGPTRSGGGHGLVGIRERAELYGGTLEVDPSPAGGVRVSARLPLTGVDA